MMMSQEAAKSLFTDETYTWIELLESIQDMRISCIELKS